MADSSKSTNATTINHSSCTATPIFENGTIMGAVYEYSISYNNSSGCVPEGAYTSIPEIVISGSRSQQNLQQPLQQSRCAADADVLSSSGSCEDTAIESTALLREHQSQQTRQQSNSDDDDDVDAADAAPVEDAVDVDVDNDAAADALPHDEFEQFVLNRSTSDSNILESSIYSELQFPPSIGSLSIGGGGDGGNNAGIGNSMAQQRQLAAARAQLQQTAATTVTATSNASELSDLLNTSTCSRDSQSRAGKRSRARKHKSKSNNNTKWSDSTAGSNASNAAATPYPPQYTAIFLEHGNVTAAANAMGQLANAAAASPFLNAPLVDAAGYLQQPYQLITTTPYAHHIGHHRHLHHRHFLDSTAALDNATTLNAANSTTDCGGGVSVGVTGIAHASSTAVVRSTFRKCFSRPVVPFVIGIFALGGAACTLGGVVLGATGLIEHTTQYLSASLLMIGIGLSLLIVAGIIWRLSSPGDADECPCYRLMETCRNCNSPYCNNRILSGSYLYPEFQHRPPPPSYLTSLHECAAIGLINGAVYSGLRVNTPPPLYRSTNSLSVYVPGANGTATLTSLPLTDACNVVAPNATTTVTLLNAMSDVATESNMPCSQTTITLEQTPMLNSNQLQTPSTQNQIQLQLPTLTKELNYPELD